MAAYLNGQVQTAYLNGQPQVAYLNGQLVLGGVVLLDLFTENYNNGLVEWIGYNDYLEVPAPQFGSLNPDEVEGITIIGLLTSTVLASGTETFWFESVLGERLLRELGSKIHIFGPGYDAVWNYNEMNTLSGTTSYRYLPDVLSKQFPNNTLLTVQLKFEEFNVINEMIAGATGDLIGYSLGDVIGSMDPDFVNGAQVSTFTVDTVTDDWVIRVEAVVDQFWWNRVHVNGTDVGITSQNNIGWTFSTGAGFSEWVRTGARPNLVNGETYDVIFEQFSPVTNDMTAGSPGAGIVGWTRGDFGTLVPDTLFGEDLTSMLDSANDGFFVIEVASLQAPDFWEKVVITGLGIGGVTTLFSSGMTYEVSPGEDAVAWFTDEPIGLQDTEDYEFRFE